MRSDFALNGLGSNIGETVPAPRLHLVCPGEGPKTSKTTLPEHSLGQMGERSWIIAGGWRNFVKLHESDEEASSG